MFVYVAYLPLFAIWDRTEQRVRRNRGSSSRMNHCKSHVHFPLIGNKGRKRKNVKVADTKSVYPFPCMRARVFPTYRERFGQWMSLRTIIVPKLCLIVVLEYGAVICIVCGPDSLLVRFVPRMRIFQPWAVRIIVPFMINRFTNGIQHTIWFQMQQTNGHRTQLNLYIWILWNPKKHDALGDTKIYVYKQQTNKKKLLNSLAGPENRALQILFNSFWCRKVSAKYQQKCEILTTIIIIIVNCEIDVCHRLSYTWHIPSVRFCSPT